MLNKILKPLAQVHMARASGAVLLIFALALLVFSRGSLKAADDGAEAFALDAPTLRGLTASNQPCGAVDTIEVQVGFRDMDVSNSQFSTVATDLLRTTLQPYSFGRCIVWHLPSAGEECTSTGTNAYASVAVATEGNVQAENIISALQSAFFMDPMCLHSATDPFNTASCANLCTRATSSAGSSTPAPASSPNSGASSSSSGGSSSSSDSSSAIIIAFAVPIGIVGLCCLAVAIRYWSKKPDSPMWPYWQKDPHSEADNNAEPAKANSGTMNEGKKESQSPPVDSTTSTAASSNGAKQPDVADEIFEA